MKQKFKLYILTDSPFIMFAAVNNKSANRFAKNFGHKSNPQELIINSQGEINDAEVIILT